MSRASIILIAILVLVVGGALFLASLDTEVAPTRVEKAVVLNDAAPQ